MIRQDSFVIINLKCNLSDHATYIMLIIAVKDSYTLHGAQFKICHNFL